jgi:hypothetical protein
LTPSTITRGSLFAATAAVALASSGGCAHSASVDNDDGGLSADGAPQGDGAQGDAPPGDGASGDGSDAACGLTSTQFDCRKCCIANHSGYATYYKVLVTCACTNPGSCATPCSDSFCAPNPIGPTADSACYACLLSVEQAPNGQCYQLLKAACDKDPDCQAIFDTCIPTECAGKP